MAENAIQVMVFKAVGSNECVTEVVAGQDETQKKAVEREQTWSLYPPW